MAAVESAQQKRTLIDGCCGFSAAEAHIDSWLLWNQRSKTAVKSEQHKCTLTDGCCGNSSAGVRMNQCPWTEVTGWILEIDPMKGVHWIRQQRSTPVFLLRVWTLVADRLHRVLKPKKCVARYPKQRAQHSMNEDSLCTIATHTRTKKAQQV
eukprot:1145631-Pelagomonas_calceolata.AAC.6